MWIKGESHEIKQPSDRNRIEKKPTFDRARTKLKLQIVMSTAK